MELNDRALSYWVICKRFRQNKTNPVMLPAAIQDMLRLQKSTSSDAVIRRVNQFISDNQRPSTVTRA